MQVNPSGLLSLAPRPSPLPFAIRFAGRDLSDISQELRGLEKELTKDLARARQERERTPSPT